MENQYFEDISKPRADEDEIIKRIKECEMVVNRLSSDDVWAVVLRDAQMWTKHLDGLWQDVMDEDKLNQMRILKLAYKHLTDLPKKYKEQLAQLQDNLTKQGEIQKDYDE